MTIEKQRLLAFDSGIGGLSIVRSLRTLAPNVLIDYLADNAVFPYGEIPSDLLQKRILTVLGQAITTLQPDAVVVACNTASTVALDALRQNFPSIPFIGCVPPIKWAADQTKTHYIGLLATPATVKRKYLSDLYAKYAHNCRLITHGSHILAGIAEDQFRGQPIDRQAVKNELLELFGQPNGELIDMVCIGCTHYSFLLDIFKEYTSPSVSWLDPADAVARQTIKVLHHQKVNNSANRQLKLHTLQEEVYFTALPASFEALKKNLKPYGFNSEVKIFPVEEGFVFSAIVPD